MKIRAGFVSNSSSASYTITVKENIDSFINTLMVECWYPYFTLDNVRSGLVEWLETLDRRIDIANRGSDWASHDSIDTLKAKKNKIEDEIKYIDNISNGPSNHRLSKTEKFNIAMIRFMRSSIKVRFNPEGDDVVLTVTTVMHNNYVEGMPDILKEIILYYSFEEPEKITLEVNHQG